MQKTTNYKFNKPELTDLPDITQLNQNFDTIDTELKAHDDEIKELGEALGGKADTSHSHTIGDLPLASVAEAKAGSIDTKVMTPAKAKESAITFGMQLKAINPITTKTDDVPTKWIELGSGVYYFNTLNYLNDQPSRYGFVINYLAGPGVFQIWKTIPSGVLAVRSGNTAGWGETWTKCANTDDLGAYLPLAGGTMNGTIQFDSTNSEIFVKQTANSNRLIILGGDAWNSGGAIYVCGKDRDVLPGHVILRASDGSNVNEVKVSPNGEFLVGDKNIVRSVNGTNADTSGNVTVTKDPNGKAFVTTDGATMNGAFSRSGNFVVNTTNNSYVQFCGGTAWANGGVIGLYGVEHADFPGAVVLRDNGDTPAELQLVNAGITHGGKNLVKSVNGTSADASGNVTLSKADIVESLGYTPLQTAPVTSVNGKTGAVTISVPATPKAYVTTTYVSGTSGYRKWSDGFIEQWGRIGARSDRNIAVTFPTAFNNTNYSITYGSATSSEGNGSQSDRIVWSSLKTTGFTFQRTDTNATYAPWYACGF